MAQMQVKTTVEAGEGLQVKCKSRSFSLIIDEPESLGGTNLGMNPMECFLNAVGACHIIVAKSFAQKNRIKLKSLKIEVEGTLDMDGFMGRNKDAKVGFSEIKTKYFIEADNTEAELEKFVEFIKDHCPVTDTIKNPAKLTHAIHRV
ncbi:MAG TPA: OsmC family protein [bacterium]|nr:OsmC family protein [bacterium]HNT65093.1 OsmC family protein [bacterium]